MIVYGYGGYKIVDHGDDDTEYKLLKPILLEKQCYCIFCNNELLEHTVP